MAKQKSRFVNCSSCGAKNVRSAKRCGSCGVSLEELKATGGAQRERARRYQQDGFSLQWALIAVVVQAVLTAALIIALPQAISSLDFEGYYGMSLSIPVWFIGGLLIGMISPGKTFIEPVMAAVVVALPTVFFLHDGFFGALGPGQTVRTMPLFMYLIMAMIGVLFCLVGAYLGERIQMGPPAART